MKKTLLVLLAMVMGNGAVLSFPTITPFVQSYMRLVVQYKGALKIPEPAYWKWLYSCDCPDRVIAALNKHDDAIDKKAAVYLFTHFNIRSRPEGTFSKKEEPLVKRVYGQLEILYAFDHIGNVTTKWLPGETKRAIAKSIATDKDQEKFEHYLKNYACAPIQNQLSTNECEEGIAEARTLFEAETEKAAKENCSVENVEGLCAMEMLSYMRYRPFFIEKE